MTHEHKDNQCYIDHELADYKIDGMKREKCWDGRRWEDEGKREE